MICKNMHKMVYKSQNWFFFWDRFLFSIFQGELLSICNIACLLSVSYLLEQNACSPLSKSRFFVCLLACVLAAHSCSCSCGYFERECVIICSLHSSALYILLRNWWNWYLNMKCRFSPELIHWIRHLVRGKCRLYKLDLFHMEFKVQMQILTYCT